MVKNDEVIFFMDAFNDIDHMIPIIDRLLAADELSVRIVTTNPFNDYRDDYRIKYISVHYGAEPVNILRYCPVSQATKNLFLRLDRLYHQGDGELPRQIRTLLRLLIKRLKAKITRGMSRLDIPAMISDIIAPGVQRAVFLFDHRDTPLATDIVAYAKTNGYPVLAVPHAVDNWDNDLIDIHQLEIHPPKDSVKSWNMYDAVVFPNEYTAARMTALGLDRKRVRVLGSTRFSKEWMNKLDHEVTPAYDLPALPPETLKVIFFLTKPLHGIFNDEVIRTIKFLSKFPNLYLIVKPHTRGMQFSQNEGSENCLIVQNDIPSEALIRWSDLIVYSATSVILDALRRDQPVLFLENTVANILIFEKFITSWNVRCRDQLRDWIWRFLADRNGRTYSKADAQNCLRELVDGSDDGGDVIGRYVELIESYIAIQDNPAGTTRGPN